ncbi:NTF2-like N-terminal transpeptidase domain-containing protein [Nocardioides sambongensis]|uniref:NTF2-like N-terminal transpeptidase domain-containing protein n=1 Tax=Nocardioides sambongensis TaxID=2589074 RepID=UPI001E2845D6|nr:NTF2-like N-terminal transpeptidase domain-containing protein [Nocardioides sambongensis]
MRLTSAGPTTLHRRRRGTPRRASAAVVVAALVALGLTACTDDGGESGESPESLADDLAAALTADSTRLGETEDGGDADGDGQGEAGSGSGRGAGAGADSDADADDRPALAGLDFSGAAPDVAATDFAAIVEGLDGTAATVSAQQVSGDGDTRTATLAWSWAVTEDESWDYTSEATLEQDGGAWTVVWDRALVEPGLGADDVLDVTTTTPERGEITGARGRCWSPSGRSSATGSTRPR